ncbi:MAG: hypothetical protein QXU32_02155 [Nitrososphaerales archaeon]
MMFGSDKQKAVCIKIIDGGVAVQKSYWGDPVDVSTVCPGLIDGHWVEIHRIGGKSKAIRCISCDAEAEKMKRKQ